MNIDCVFNIDWSMYIDWLLRILQIATFIAVIIKITFQNKVYINNIEIKEIKPFEFESLHTNLPENMPSLRMKWKTSQGEIGEYTFYSNMYNGNVNISSFKYKLTLKRKILALFGL